MTGSLGGPVRPDAGRAGRSPRDHTIGRGGRSGGVLSKGNRGVLMQPMNGTLPNMHSNPSSKFTFWRTDTFNVAAITTDACPHIYAVAMTSLTS